MYVQTIPQDGGVGTILQDDATQDDVGGAIQQDATWVAQDDGRRTIQQDVIGVAQYNVGGEIQEGGEILAPNVEELQSQAIHSNHIKGTPRQLVDYYIIGASSFARLIETTYLFQELKIYLEAIFGP